MIMNNNKQLYGVVTEPDKPKEYEGKQTSSARVTVDNNEKTISVDVNFTAGLGDTSSTAYPGSSGKLNRALIIDTTQKLEAEIARATTVEEQLKDYIDDEVWNLKLRDTDTRNDLEETLETSIKEIKEEYTTKEYVHEKLVEFSKLSKQVVDYVNTDNNTVVINGFIEKPLDGVIYFVKDSSVLGNDIYQEYTLLNGILTLIGGTSIDLSDYALKKDIPDVSEFIDEIPPEYVTEEELKVQGFYKKEDVETDVTKLLQGIKLLDGGTASQYIQIGD